MAHQQGFRTFSLLALRAARLPRPTEQLVEDLCRALTAVVECQTIELWLMEGTLVMRWCLHTRRDHFTRWPDVDPDLFAAMRLQYARRPKGRYPDPPTGALDLVRATNREPMVSVLCRPLMPGPEPKGFLVLASLDDERLAGLNEPLLYDLTQTLAAALAHNQLQQAQRERVKELSCLYELARLATAEPKLDLDGTLQRVVELLPPSWQYPELAVARLVLDGASYTTRAFDEAWSSHRSEIVVGDTRRGFVEVAYRQAMPSLYEGPFLEEERQLLDTVSREVSTLIERKAALEDRVILQEQLQHADRLATIGHLAAGIAHELNEPLGAILGFSQLARKHPGIPDGVDRDLEKIEAAALHAREVTAGLTHVGRRNAPKLERLDFNAVVSDGLSFLGARLAKDRIELGCELERHLPAVMGNRAQLQQIVINLVVNAIQAMPRGGTLTVTTRRDDDSLTLTVTDSGEGMDAAVQARIFEPFFTTKRATEGTGLGLPVVRGILESMGGGIDVTSAQNEGSSFRVHIPLAPPRHGQPGRRA